MVLSFFLLFLVVVTIFSVVVVTGAKVLLVGAAVEVVNSTVVVVGAAVVVVVVVVGILSQAIEFPTYFNSNPRSQDSHSTAPCSGQKKLSTTPFGHSQTFKTHLLFFMWYS